MQTEPAIARIMQKLMSMGAHSPQLLPWLRLCASLTRPLQAAAEWAAWAAEAAEAASAARRAVHRA